MNKQAAKSGQVESEIQLHFKGPYNRPVTAHLVVSNPSRKTTAFTVKTKSHKRFSGSSKGIILPGASYKMAFRLKPLQEGEQVPCNHKLVITFASSDVTGSVEAIFAAAKSKEIKTFPIRCVLDDLPVVESIRDGKKGAKKNAPSLQKEIKSEVFPGLPYQRLYPDLSQLRLDDEKYFVPFSPKSDTPGGDNGDQQGKEANETL